MRKMKATNGQAILSMSPYEVAMWFQQSDDPMLAEIGRDLEPATYQHPDGFHITTDLVACLLRLSEICNQDGTFVRGANATIAECVFGTREQTGGAYNARIQRIKAELQTMFAAIATTTPTDPDPAPAPAVIAA